MEDSEGWALGSIDGWLDSDGESLGAWLGAALMLGLRLG
jgi:hypothetical protein